MQPRPRFEELDYRMTPLGELILRRRTLPTLDDVEVYEIILGDAFLMTSLFTAVEEALSKLGLAAAAEEFPEAGSLDVVVGGLGLGHTARAALDHPGTRSLSVVEFLQPVIEWHEQGLVPLGRAMSEDPRCRFAHGDFFELAATPDGFAPGDAGRKFHAVLLDIDHSPTNLLHERNAGFYQVEGLRKLAAKLHPGGVFALWSDDPPAEEFMAALDEVFVCRESHVVEFYNPHQDRNSASTVYVARTQGE